MGRLVVLEGYVEDGKSGSISVLMLDGTSLSIEKSSVVKSAPMDTNKDALTRLFLNEDAEITITVTAGDLDGRGLSASGSILKWIDDGGTLSKSKDDTIQGAGSILKWVDDGGTIRKSLDDT
ncbi:hypothetical protein LYSHEL_01720 [Lysobacter helvus]|uniref:Uncharacterized protein n=2 Tax=Lysobacteraceae TaxID=32033 RepID=A0ABN6FNL9_9GAMM|nr:MULTISPECIES: hypothetical protein [Lysobacter]BCT91148.1 hypothetical protein LYSCAS_01720 [Lysobacter caseinilyticus]BCT94301.1 hypothetical protein LYSHEL_01720 [Lysobacter helvus]